MNVSINPLPANLKFRAKVFEHPTYDDSSGVTERADRAAGNTFSDGRQQLEIGLRAMPLLDTFQ